MSRHASRSGELKLRKAGPTDAHAIATLVRACFETFRAWAATDWLPPPEPIGGIEVLPQRLGSSRVWAVVAEQGTKIRAVVAFRPLLSERWSGDPVPGVAHLWLLFVHPDLWGRGMGRSLHDAAVTEIRARGYERAHLWTPTGGQRARALYERAGWVRAGSLYGDELGVDLTVYELDLKAPSTSS